MPSSITGPFLNIAKMALTIACIVLIMIGSSVSISIRGNAKMTTDAVTCPDPADLAPCTCYANTTGLYLDCSQVVGEDQLAAILSKPLLTKDFQAFAMYSNPAITMLRPDDFGHATFEEFVINDGTLEDIHNLTFANSYTAATTIDLFNNRVSRFPFHELSSFSRLQHLDLSYNAIHELPMLESPTLVTFNVAGNALKGEVSGGVLQQLPSLQATMFHGNSLTHVQPGALTGLAELRLVDLARNQLSHLEAGTIHLTTTKESLISFTLNLIRHIDVDAIKVSGPGLVLLNDNFLTELREDVFKPLMEAGVTLVLGGNPWACGCDLLWMLESDTFKSHILDTPRCVDGRFMVLIDPDSINDDCHSTHRP